MFGKDHSGELKFMKQQIEDLMGRVQKLEADCAPVRVGKLPSYESGIHYWNGDTRPTVSLHSVAVRLMEHCGLTFERIPPTAEQIVVKKAK